MFWSSDEPYSHWVLEDYKLGKIQEARILHLNIIHCTLTFTLGVWSGKWAKLPSGKLSKVNASFINSLRTWAAQPIFYTKVSFHKHILNKCTDILNHQLNQLSTIKNYARSRWKLNHKGLQMDAKTFNLHLQWQQCLRGRIFKLHQWYVMSWCLREGQLFIWWKW